MCTFKRNSVLPGYNKSVPLSIRYPDSETVVAHIGEKVDEGSSEDYDASDDGYPGNTVHRRETKETKETVVIKHLVIGGRGKTLLACQSPFHQPVCLY